MKIIDNTNYFTREKDYSIFIHQEDDLEPLDITESFKKQYPDKRCVISFSRVVKVEVGFLIIGLPIPLKERKR